MHLWVFTFQYSLLSSLNGYQPAMKTKSYSDQARSNSDRAIIESSHVDCHHHEIHLTCSTWACPFLSQHHCCCQTSSYGDLSKHHKLGNSKTYCSQDFYREDGSVERLIELPGSESAYFRSLEYVFISQGLSTQHLWAFFITIRKPLINSKPSFHNILNGKEHHQASFSVWFLHPSVTFDCWWDCPRILTDKLFAVLFLFADL